MSEAMTPADAFVIERDGDRKALRRLGANKVGLPGVLMQAVAQISPTLGIFYTIAFTTGQAGVTAPLTYLLAFILCLTLAVPLGGLARRMPSAGGYYTYVSEGLGPKTGYMAGWLYGTSVALVPAALAAFTGAVLHDELDAEFGFGLPWWVYAVAILALCWYRRATAASSLSARFMLTMGAYEIVIGLGLALTGIISPGPGRLSGARIPAVPYPELLRVLPGGRAQHLRVHRLRVGRQHRGGEPESRRGTCRGPSSGRWR